MGMDVASRVKNSNVKTAFIRTTSLTTRRRKEIRYAGTTGSKDFIPAAVVEAILFDDGILDLSVVKARSREPVGYSLIIMLLLLLLLLLSLVLAFALSQFET
jgi:hypothetical protein